MAATLDTVIRDNESYLVPDFRRKARLGLYAFRKAREAGLVVVEFGRKRYVRGCDWLEFLEKQAERAREATA